MCVIYTAEAQIRCHLSKGLVGLSMSPNIFEIVLNARYLLMCTSNRMVSSVINNKFDEW